MIDSTKYITWQELIEYIYIETGLIYTSENVHLQHYGLSINGKLPYSISEYEFNYMKDFIVQHNLKSGYELATGTAISTIGIGLGLKQTGGKLISLDSYIEYETQRIPINVCSGPHIPNSKSYEDNKRLIELFKLDNVDLIVGWSPKSAYKCLPDKIDFVFLDCPKTVDDFERDIQPILNKLDDKFAIFIHDVFAYPPQEFNKKAIEIFGVNPKYIVNFYDKYNQVFPLTVVSNIP